MRITFNTELDKQTAYLLLLLNLHDAKVNKELQVLQRLVTNRKGAVSTFTASDRKEIMDTIGVSKQHLTNILRSLQDKKFIYGARGYYVLSPVLTDNTIKL